MNSSNKLDEQSVIRLAVTCFAECITMRFGSLAHRLAPFKFNKRGEGFARSVYYQPALAFVRKYHASENNPQVVREARFELRKKADDAVQKRDRVRFENNAEALEAYLKIYGNRKFRVLPCHRLTYKIGPVVLTASPDLWVEENGNEILLKLGVAKKNRSFVDVMLTVIRKAAVSKGHRVRAKNVVYLDISNGNELICVGPITRFNFTFRSAARAIAEVWPTVSQHNKRSETAPT